VFLCIVLLSLFSDRGGVTDHKISGWPCMVHTPQVIDTITIALKENRGENKSKRLLYGKECYKDILFIDKKNLLWRKLSISKMMS
jgi:hypothetical protein